MAARIQEMLLTGTQVRDGENLRPVKPEDIVILLRSPNSVGRYYQQALESLGIRCDSGGGEDLLSTGEVSAFRSLLETILNPRQDIPLLSVLMSPVFGFTADDVAAIRSQNREGCFYDALTAGKSEKAAAFLEILSSLRQLARTASLTELLRSCLSQTRLDSIYAAMEGGKARLHNLQSFFQLAADYEGTGIRDLSQFMDHLTALEAKGLTASAQSSAGSVTIMSIHKSKGLEFPVVFLCALSRKFNQESLKRQILCDKDLGLGLSVADGETRTRYASLPKCAIAQKIGSDSLSEEMRVLYVAMTRARDRLILVYSSENLQKNLENIALRMDFDGGSLLARDAGCPGIWVLMAALRRTEAGELHNLGAKPRDTAVSQINWKIRVVHAGDPAAGAEAEPEPGEAMPAQAAAFLRQALSFDYGHWAATKAPSKQTATGRKDREKDLEAALLAAEPKKPIRSWREPGFLQKPKEGKRYGTAVHAAMQYLDFSRCGSLEGLREELERLRQEGLLSREQADMLDGERIYPFFETDIGRQLTGGAQCLREFKFSILDDGSHYGEGLAGEQVLLQGVVDCALLEEDGITVLDFKTDYVREDTLKQTAEKYALQLDTYCQALERIYELPVKGSSLYFFHLNRFYKMS